MKTSMVKWYKSIPQPGFNKCGLNFKQAQEGDSKWNHVDASSILTQLLIFTCIIHCWANVKSSVSKKI